MDENLKRLTEEFVTQRVNHYGANETKEANSAYMEFRAAALRLRETLTAEQKKLLTACENAYRVADGESGRFYYKAGFEDALALLLRRDEK
jgi:hypothetical protein